MSRLALLPLALLAALLAVRSITLHLGARRAVAVSHGEGSGSPKELVAEVERALRLDPLGGGELPKLGARLAAAGELDAALRVARNGFRASGTNDLRLLEASILAERPTTAKEAEPLFRRLRAAAPADPTAAQNLLRLAAAAGDLGALRRLADEELRRRPAAFDPLVARGNVALRADGDLLSAARFFRLALDVAGKAPREEPIAYRESETRSVAEGMLRSLGEPGESSWGAAPGGAR